MAKDAEHDKETKDDKGAEQAPATGKQSAEKETVPTGSAAYFTASIFSTLILAIILV